LDVPTAAARIIEQAIADRAFPGAALELGRSTGDRAAGAYGCLTDEPDARAVTPQTIYDLASLTKVISTATLAMHAIEQGRLALDDRVADRLPEWRGGDREDVTIADLLEHASGLTAYLPFFRDYEGRSEFQRAIATMPLEDAPRTHSIYSDLGFILLGFILEDVGGAPLAEQFQRVFHLKVEATNSRASRAEATTLRYRGFRLQAEDLCFNPPRALRDRIAPTEVDPWRGRLLQGEAHDENAWALGGAAGHAGLFGTAAATGSFAAEILKGLRGAPNAIAPAPAIQRFAQRSHVPQSSRALAWDTMLPTSSCGAKMSPRAIGHTGFTGTSLWIDPDLDLYVVLLTNRVYPTRDNDAIRPVRRAVHDAVVEGLGR